MAQKKSEMSLEEVDTIEDLQTYATSNSVDKVHTLGTIRLHNKHTKERILIPQPSSDPNDPLNWSTSFRYYNAVLVCLAMVMCNFLAAGPTVAIVEITVDFFGPPGPTFPAHIAKVAYFFTTTALMQGVGNLFWMPLITKYGRRPVYIASFTIYTATAIWAGVATEYANELVARIVMGLAAGSGECIAPLTIADLFFLHERGFVMAMYTASLNFGVSVGIILAGAITISNSWRYIYYVATALIGVLTLLVIFTMPETSYIRSQVDASDQGAKSTAPQQDRPKETYLQSLKIFHRTLTSESLWRIFMRPIVMLMLPSVLWATLVMSVTIGFIVAVTSNFASAFETAYGFEPWQSGLCFVAGLVGAAIGIFFGGTVSDWVADFFTKRNDGIREPEFRLPAISIGMIASPVALVLYGVGIEHRLHWIVSTIGLGLMNFAISQATNVSLVYVIDAYRPIAGETVVTQLGFKSAFGFLLSFYTNPWIAQSGYQNAFGAMAGISGGILLLWIPFFIWGKRIRHASLEWPIVRSYVQWNLDREVGE